MVAKSELKLIRSLQQKKYRNQHQLFFVEGKKTVQELLNSDIEPYAIFCTDLSFFNFSDSYLKKITNTELQQISMLKNPNGVLGVFHIPEPKSIDVQDWVVALDDVRDPGNMGTIIRLCDWFGVQNLVCSQNTVDCYNSKVLQATMGSISRVNIVYMGLEDFLSSVAVPIYGSFMDGDNVYETRLPEKSVLVMGNEGKGISEEVKKICGYTISIPRYGASTTESLNVATAAAILLNEVRRG